MIDLLEDLVTEPIGRRPEPNNGYGQTDDADAVAPALRAVNKSFVEEIQALCPMAENGFAPLA